VLFRSLDIVHPETAVDVGCGHGAWARVLLDHGIDTLGVDGDYVDRAALLIPPDRFVARDLARGFNLDRTFDLAISMEVGEHLPPGWTDGFVQELTRIAPVVLFSAAIPMQGGTQHVNERWQSEWAARFAARGYDVFDVVRPRVWTDSDVEMWYSQNTLLYVRGDLVAGLELPERARLVDVVHPQTYTKAIAYRHPRNLVPRGYRRLVEQARRAMQ